MALKPILQIEVNDSKFKAFKALFDKYQEQVAKLPPEWQKLNAEVGETKSFLEQLSEIALDRLNLGDERVENEKKANKFANATATVWQTITSSVASVNTYITQATSSLLKWSALTAAFGGLLG